MPSKQQRTPMYRLHKPSGQSVVTIDGRDFYLGRHETDASREAYDRLIGEWLVCGRSSANQLTATSLTIAELAAAYWSFARGLYQKDGEPTGELGKLKIVLRYLKRLYGRSACSKFGPLGVCPRNGLIRWDYDWSVA